MFWDLNIANSSTASQCRWYTMFVMFKAWYRQQRLPGTLLPNQSVGVTSILGLLQISAVWNKESQRGLGWKVPCRPAHSKPLALGRHIPLGQVDISGPHSAKRCHKKKKKNIPIFFKISLLHGYSSGAMLLILFYCESFAWYQPENYIYGFLNLPQALKFKI